MKKFAVTLPNRLARRVRLAAAKEDKSVSRFVTDLLKERYGGEVESTKKRALFWQFLDGPGFAGASKAWPGREVLYGEREDELLRRYESAVLPDKGDASAESNG